MHCIGPPASYAIQWQIQQPAYMQSDQGWQLKVEKTGVHRKLQIIDNQHQLTEGGNRHHETYGSLQRTVCQVIAKQYSLYKAYCFITNLISPHYKDPQSTVRTMSIIPSQVNHGWYAWYRTDWYPILYGKETA